VLGEAAPLAAGDPAPVGLGDVVVPLHAARTTARLAASASSRRDVPDVPIGAPPVRGRVRPPLATMNWRSRAIVNADWESTETWPLGTREAIASEAPHVGPPRPG
jgi:hypothetical protein